MATTNDLKNGLVMVIDGQLWQVVEFQHVKPGKGPAFVRTKIKNVLSGKTVDKTFNAGLKIETATVDRRDMTYLYQDGTDYVFMDQSTYEQINVPAETVGDARNFMVENQDVIVSQHDGTVLFVELPATVVLTITHTEPGLQGDRSSAGTKPATLETGYEIQVPLFMEEGTRVKVDTRDGSYSGRVTEECRSSTASPRARRPASARPTSCTRPISAGWGPTPTCCATCCASAASSPRPRLRSRSFRSRSLGEWRTTCAASTP